MSTGEEGELRRSRLSGKSRPLITEIIQNLQSSSFSSSSAAAAVFDSVCVPPAALAPSVAVCSQP